MDPRYRFTLVISFLLTGWWIYVVLSTYLFGERGLNFERYQEGIVWVGSAAFAGFALVWCASRIVLWQRTRKTGFEAAVSDEFNTRFEMKNTDGSSQPFKMSLSKFLPQLVAVPDWPDMTPLEAELVGFLNAYRHWPTDLSQAGKPDNQMVSLYEQAFARWQIMRHLPGSGPWHRVMALAKDLALVHAYKEERSSFPLQQFWKRDRVRFSKRCRPHGGIAAFVLSTLPAFRSMAATPEGVAIQRTLLTALRYHEDPTMLPANSTPLARELVDYLWRSESQLRHLSAADVEQMTPERLEALRATLAHHWLGILSQLQPQEAPGADVVFLKQANGTFWLKADALLDQVSFILPADLRPLLHVETSGHEGEVHPAWVHFHPLLQDMKLIASEHDGAAATNGYFTLQFDDLTMKNMVKLNVSHDTSASLTRHWGNLHGFDGFVDVVMDVEQLKVTGNSKATALDAKIGDLF